MSPNGLTPHGIPHLITGGYAVQKRGYPRFTVDLDLIVRDFAQAREALESNGFTRKPASVKVTVTDPATNVDSDLFSAHGTIDNAPLACPMPTVVSDTPQILSLEQLLSGKLSMYMARSGWRLQDLADVAELIMRAPLPRDVGVDPMVRRLYQDTWDSLIE